VHQASPLFLRNDADPIMQTPWKTIPEVKVRAAHKEEGGREDGNPPEDDNNKGRVLVADVYGIPVKGRGIKIFR